MKNPFVVIQSIKVVRGEGVKVEYVVHIPRSNGETSYRGECDFNDEITVDVREKDEEGFSEDRI